ncbi:hypothetical protein HHK36_003671 [Tetracentron sinense]|uniref:Targeting protein for Xklp2 n=1 Tax=Tetracentron sinense TaxID=13715 RepID=A0A834ZRJ8_TETSI|nr:hypothetical protein HHK36_003671 [Tetracentron sinense]
MAVDDGNATIDETYEFSAPRFFDFINGESEADMHRAEHWFENSLSYAPSPFMPKIKGRSVQIESLCDFGQVELLQKASGSSVATTASNITNEETLGPEEENSTKLQSETVPVETRNEEGETHQCEKENRTIPKEISVDKQLCEDNNGICTEENGSVLIERVTSITETGKASEKETTSSVVSPIQGIGACTPKPHRISGKGESTDSKYQTAKKIASLVRNPSALKLRNHSQLSQAKRLKLTSARRATTAKNTVAIPDFVQENQAIKRQKLEEGRSRQILNVKSQSLPHKSRPGLTNGAANLCYSTIKTRKERRKPCVREPAAPFISMAEMVKRFQSKTREVELPHSILSHVDNDFDASTAIEQRKPRLTLTRPKEPELETSHRVRSVRVKSSAELEEEMMAKIPKFKARPVNKKILEAPTLPALPRSTPQLPEFQEFHLKTMEKANQNTETSTVVSSSEASCQNQGKPHKLTEPRTPRLQTSLRSRPSKVKSSQELEQEELEKMPKFKARPLNKKIFESKGGLGMFCNAKRQVTKPREFHFATEERIPPPTAVIDIFNKLSVNSESHHDHRQIPKITTPNPFYLHTQERGAEKEKRRVAFEVLQKQFEEERARIHKAIPYPYTTDYPVIPPKPQPKKCTKPEPFQLESLVRHEEEMQKEMEERQRMEKEEAQMRHFKAQPIMKEDPIPVPEKERKPLTQVQEFVLHVDHRAVDRAEFDKNIKEKELVYKRYREEYESEKLMEEEKALKQLRRTMVPHARPLPKFDHPFHPQKSSKDTTKPKSPNLCTIQREERRRLVSAAAHMR